MSGEILFIDSGEFGKRRKRLRRPCALPLRALRWHAPVAAATVSSHRCYVACGLRRRPLRRAAGGGGGAGDTPTARPSTGSTRPRTSGGGRPRTGGAGRRKQASPFRSAVDRNSLPLRLEARPSGRRIILWEVDCGGPEAAALLPLLVSGLAERDEPYNVVAAEATIDVLENIGGGVVAMLDDIVPALKSTTAFLAAANCLASPHSALRNGVQRR